MEIFSIYLQVVSKFVITKNCIVMMISLFRKDVTTVISVLWMIIESRFNFKFFTLFCNGLIQEPITKIHPATENAPFRQFFRELSNSRLQQILEILSISFQKHLKIAKEICDRAGEGRAYGNLGNAYKSLFDSFSGNSQILGSNKF